MRVFVRRALLIQDPVPTGPGLPSSKSGGVQDSWDRRPWDGGMELSTPLLPPPPGSGQVPDWCEGSGGESQVGPCSPLLRVLEVFRIAGMGGVGAERREQGGLGVGTRAGRGRGECLSHLVSEVSRPLPSLVYVEPSQPLLSHKPVFCRPQPLPRSSPAPQFGPAPSPGWAPAAGKAPAPSPFPALSPGETEKEGVRGEDQRGERVGS